MSHVATGWAIKQRGLEPVTKLLLWCLADRHNGKTGRCDPSQKRLAEDCEISRATVNRHLIKLENAGFIRREKRSNSSTNRQENTSYILAFQTNFPVSQIEQKPCLKTGESRVSVCDTNLVREPGKELCVGAANSHTSEFFEEFWKAYPRPRGKVRTAELFETIVASGVDPKWIIQAASKFAAENAGNARQYLKHSNNWLEHRCWEDFPITKPIDHSLRNGPEEQAAFWAFKIRAGRYIPPTAIKPQALNIILAQGLASPEEIKRAGLSL